MKSKAQKIVDEYKEKFEKINCKDLLDTDRLCEDCAHLKTSANICKENWEDELLFLNNASINQFRAGSILYEEIKVRIIEIKESLKILEEIK